MRENYSSPLDLDLDEMIPVDQFFEDYLNRLQNSALTDDVHPYASSDVVQQPLDFPFGTMEGQGESFVPEPFGSTSYPVDKAYLPLSQPFGTDGVNGNHRSLDNSMLLNPAYFENPGPTHSAPFLKEETINGLSSDMAMEGLEDPFVESSALEEDYKPFKSLHQNGMQKRGRHKSVRQQQLNKLAQQRYRERKKAKTLDLESSVSKLTQQVNELSRVQQQKIELEQKNALLEKKLLEKEAELRTLKAQMESSRFGGDSIKELPSFLKGEKSAKLIGNNSKPAKIFHQKVKELQKYLKDNNLDPSYLVNPLDDSIPQKAVDDIYHLVGDVCTTCMQLTRLDGPNLWDLISASLESKQKESLDREMWRGIASSLKLGKEQIQSALNLRAQHLAKLEKIYAQRQALNLEAIKHLLPADQGGRAPAQTPLGCFNITTFVQRMRHRSRLTGVLDKLKENLSKEQKLDSELEYMTYYRVMSPLQGAWFTVSAYPHQCDSLEFLNAVMDLYGPKNGNIEREFAEDE